MFKTEISLSKVTSIVVVGVNLPAMGFEQMIPRALTHTANRYGIWSANVAGIIGFSQFHLGSSEVKKCQKDI